MIDKMMAKYGYILTKENQYGAYYEKQEPQNFNHVICVIHKANGKHLMQSYDSKVIDGRNEVCGVEIPVLLFAWLKAKQMKHRYHWN